MLGLPICVWVSSSCGEWGSSSLWCDGFSLRGHVLLWALQKGVGSQDTRVGSSQTRVPCIGRPILNPWTSKEAPHTLRTTVLEASESQVQRDAASQLGRPASAAGTRPRFCCEMAKCVVPGIPSQQTSWSHNLSFFLIPSPPHHYVFS